ncbi:hypothetical protein SUGI_0757420 [Cryptomeria japonica]|uniref:uncharacterized protein LOC131045035 n=1 Tax=Cryptomeria japonica TaxID=3369 RepID=UPI0024147562|nr:uncharacterized protein LOC131045035 [Cryptomeria japonica]GLJ37333.1 hypothetical protein SUGI_0757420 [Cryptomeria japonica]
MASVVEPVAQTSTAGCLAKSRDVFSLSYSGKKKEVTDAPSSAPKTNTAFYSFKRPVENFSTPNIDGAVDSSTALNIDGHVDRAKSLSGSINSESTNGSEAIQDNGPSTPMRYLAKPKHVETPDSAISLPALSLATVSCYVDKEMVKQANAEFNKVDSPFGCLGKFDKEPQSIIKSGSSNVQGVLGNTSEISKLTGSEIQQTNLNIHMPGLTQSHIPQSCNSVNSAFSQQSSTIIPGKVNPIKSSVSNTNSKQQIMFNNGQQGPESTKYPQVIPLSVNGVQLNLSQGLQCEDTFQGSAARQKLRTPCISNQFSYPIANGRQLEVNYMPLLQTPLMATSLGGQQALTAENNISHSSKNNQPFVKKRKLASQKPQVGESSVGLNQCALEVRQRAANVENHHYEVGGKHQKGQVKQFQSPNDKVENAKSVNGFGGLPSVNGVGNIRHLVEPVTMKTNGGTTNSSFTCGPLGSNVHNTSPSEAGKTPSTLSLEATKSETVSNQPRGNTEGQSLDVQSHPLGLRLLTFPAYAPMPAAVSTFSSGGPSLPQYINQQGNGEDSYPGKRQNPKRTSPDLEWGKFLALSATPDTSAEVEETQTETLLPYQKRFMRLQAYLKQCDEPNQKYLKSLRTLSAAARSGHAVELETRAIMLSLEEGKEIHRMKILNVFAKNLSNEGDASLYDGA